MRTIASSDGVVPDTRDQSRVAVCRVARAEYPTRAPFHPKARYPEYRGELASLEENLVYDAVRTALRLLGMDEAHFDTAEWNPLGSIVRPGDRVILKPNFLAEGHALRRSEWLQVITHGSVIRAVLDYVILALKVSGAVF